jgi:hypothetical protein
VQNGFLCVTMSVVDECALVETSLARLRTAYPDAMVVLLVDGGPEAMARWQRQADPNTLVRDAFGSYRTERGGAVVDLHLRSFMATGADWWMKMDPDTFVRRRLRLAVNVAAFSGTIQTGLPRPSLQGGCIVGGRQAVSRLLCADVLGSSALLDYEATWAAGNGLLLNRARERGLVSFDFVHAWACTRAGVPLEDHPEIKSLWLRPPVDGTRYAVTHPHKNLGPARDSDNCDTVECSRAADLDALLSTILSDTSVVALVGDHVLTPSRGRIVAADGELAISQVCAARAEGVRFLVIPAAVRAWFRRCPAFAGHLLSNYEVVYWQDDIAMIFDLSRPSLNGPHLEWYQHAR